MKQLSDFFWRRNKGFRKIMGALVSFLCVCAMVLSNALPYIPAARVQAAQSPKLADLIIDKVYQFEPVGEIPAGVDINAYGFAPEITRYEGTAYSSADTIKVYPFVESGTAKVYVNGMIIEKNASMTIDIHETGNHEVMVRVVDNGLSIDYVVNVNKVDSDYRERRSITKNEAIMEKLSVESDAGKSSDAADLIDILKKDYLVDIPFNNGSGYVNTDESYWSPASVPVGGDGNLTSFTIDLGDVYSISRIRALFGPGNLSIWNSQARISVSTDGVNWKTPVTKGNMRTGTQWDQNVTRYEFGVSYDARYIKFEVSKWQYTDKNLRLYQFMVFYDAGKVPDQEPAPEGGSIPHQHDDNHQYLSSGQATVIERGYPLSGWTPSSGYGRGVPTAEEAKQFGYDGPLFYDPDFQNPDYMLYNPDALWGIAKAPFGGNTMDTAGEPREFVPESMKPYVSNAISFCFGDEGHYSTKEAEEFGAWFDWTREHYPGVILHSNQNSNWGREALKEYMRIANPDMLSWDDYYWRLRQEENLKAGARNLLGPNTYWNLDREMAYGGIDGTGTKPILVGQYLDTWQDNQPTSVKNMVANLSVLSGLKWLNFFRVEYQFDHSYLWDEDGTPTRGLLDWGTLIDRIHAIDPQITRLNNDWIMFRVGEVGNGSAGADAFRMSNFEAEGSREKNAEFGLAGLTVESLSNVWNGQTGDVMLGYFKPLPGLYESEIMDYFEGYENPRAFMVMNALAAGLPEFNAEVNSADRIRDRQRGAAENTRQRITVQADSDFVKAGIPLYLVDKDDRDVNGKAKIKPVTLDENGCFTMTLGGGETNLYFWGLRSSVSASSQSEGHYASFAYDGHPQTYWQPQEAAADGVYTLTYTENVTFNRITMKEKGDAIQAYAVEYLDAAEDGENWKLFGEGNHIGAIASVDSMENVTARAVRLKITDSNGLPAIYDVVFEAITDDSNEPRTITVNDNTMGEGINRFSYDDMWSYREAETGGASFFPIEGDGHFSNFNNAMAKFKFYGSRAEILLRNQNLNSVSLKLLDSEGNQVGDVKPGAASVVFDGLEQGVYTVEITKVTNDQPGIDGAKVTFTGAIPEELLEEQKTDPKADQVYLNQRVFSDVSRLDNYFEYSNGPVINNNQQSGAYAPEANGWVEHAQNVGENNIGFTRTKQAGDSYTVNFYGTGIQLYSSVFPENGRFGTADNLYGKVFFELDGEPMQDAAYKNVNKAVSGPDEGKYKNGNISVRIFELEASQTNERHTLTVTVESGYNRIDYAVVNRCYEENGPVGSYAVTLDIGEHGSASLSEPFVVKGDSVSVDITPDQGYEIYRIVVNDKLVPNPEDGRLVISNIQKDTDISVSFRVALYEIRTSDMTGGGITPDRMTSYAGDTVTLKPDPFGDNKLKDGSLKVTDSTGAVVELKLQEDGSYQFLMPADRVTVWAEFEVALYSIIVQPGITGGTLSTDPGEQAAYWQKVLVTVQPDEGMRLVEDSLKALLEDGGTVKLDTTPEARVYTFAMRNQTVKLTAEFERIPDCHISVEKVNNGSAVVSNSEVPAGEDVTVEFKPNDGYKLGALMINGEPWYVPTQDLVTPENLLVLRNVPGDMVITPVFIDENTTMLAGTVHLEGEGRGSVEPAQQLIMEGGNAVVLINADAGYMIENIYINGEPYTTQRKARAAAATVSGNNLTGAGTSVTDGNAVALANISGWGGYALTSYARSMKLLLDNVGENLDIRVQFAPVIYKVEADSTEHGMITLSGAEAAVGEEVTITLHPEDGYRLSEYSLRAVTEGNQHLNLTIVEPGKTYTFIMPKGDVRVTAGFDQIPQPIVEYRLNVDTMQNGCLAVGDIMAQAGKEVLIKVEPSEGYRLTKGSLKVETDEGGTISLTEVAEGKVYQFTMPDKDVRITGAFEKVPEKPDNSGGSSGGSSNSSSNDSVPEISVNWPQVQKEVEDKLRTMGTTGSAGTLDFTVGGSAVVPARILETIQGKSVTLAFHTGSRLTFSTSGRDIPKKISSDLNLTMHQGSSILPAQMVSQKTQGATLSYQFDMAYKGSFGLTVNAHLNLGKENSGHYANLYSYNFLTNALEYQGSFRITEDGQAMFGLNRGAAYLVTVTKEKVKETVSGSIGGVAGNTYVVKSGDTFGLIAARQKTRIADLIALNPQITNINRIYPGQRIYVR